MSKLFEAIVKYGELIKSRRSMTIVLSCIEFVIILQIRFLCW
ncbi:MAG: hypothetical protein AAF630_17310 [Cyanobacteria bacterium P01_C01_bin.38]